MQTPYTKFILRIRDIISLFDMEHLDDILSQKDRERLMMEKWDLLDIIERTAPCGNC